MREFKLFGAGFAGLPGEVDIWLSKPGEVDNIAGEIIQACQNGPDPRRRRSPGDQWATYSYMLVAWHNKHKKPIPANVMTALAYAMGLVSGDTSASTASSEVKAKVGVPTNVEMWKLDAFLLASRLDGEADASGGAKLTRDALGKAVGVGGRTIDSWRKMPLYIRRRNWPEPAATPVPRGTERQLEWLDARLGKHV